VKADITRIPGVVVPIVNSRTSTSDATYEEQMLEWLGMVTLDSPRIRGNEVDRYLCRYDLPEAFDIEGTDAPEPQSLVRLRWHGLASASFILSTWLIPKAVLGQHWFAMNVRAFNDKSYSILCSGGRNVLLWECG